MNFNSSAETGFKPAAASVGTPRSHTLTLIEGLVLIGGATLLARLDIFSGVDWPLDPVVVAVAILATQYGVVGGLIAAAAGAGMGITMGLPARPIELDYLTYLGQIWTGPLVYLVTALLLGLISGRHLGELTRTRAELAQASLECELISGQYDVLAARARRLERRLAGLDARPGTEHIRNE